MQYISIAIIIHILTITHTNMHCSYNNIYIHKYALYNVINCMSDVEKGLKSD